MTEPRGTRRLLLFNDQGYTTDEFRALGTPEEQTTSYQRQGGTQRLLSTTDALGRATAFGYDAMGNLNSVTRLDPP